MKTNKKQLESEIQSKILRYLEGLPGCYPRKIITANKSTVDVLLCLGGRFVAIEIKRPGEKPTPLQYYNMRQVRDAGGYAFWVDNEVDLNIYIAALTPNPHRKHSVEEILPPPLLACLLGEDEPGYESPF